MADVGLQALNKVVAFVGEPDERARKELRQILNHAGLRQVSVHGNLKNIVSLMEHVTPDLIIVSDDLDPEVFDFIRDIRHNKMGVNPFVLVTTRVSPKNADGVKRAMQVGTDDIIIKPVREEQMLQRLKRVTVSRAAFVVTSDYIGPNRRIKKRPSDIPGINVLNTVFEKANGRNVDVDSVKEAVDSSMQDVLHARLDGHGYRLGFVCNLIVDAYEAKKVTVEIQKQLNVLVNLLADAARTAERLDEPDLSILCGSLSKDMGEIAEHYEEPIEKDIDLLQKLSKAVISAVRPHAPFDKIEEETRQGVKNYQSRERGGFGKSQDIQGHPDEPPIVDIDEPVIQIMPVAKGHYVFKQGDPATSAYIPNSGAVAIFKEEEGKRIPIARVKKGEFFGEMAIIDSRPRRNSAMALEDSTLSLVSKDMIEEKLANSDKMIRMVLNMLSNSLKSVHDSYGPKSRNVVDSVREMREEALRVRSYVENVAAQAVKDEGAVPMEKIVELTDTIINLVENMPDLDHRAAAVPSENELKI